MTALYTLDLTTMHHLLFCNGIGAKFDINGKYVGYSGAMKGTPVDVVSVLQQGSACEVAVLSSDEYTKKCIDLYRAQSWVQNCPTPVKTVFTLRRKVGEDKCTQTLYVFGHNTIKPYLGSLL